MQQNWQLLEEANDSNNYGVLTLAQWKGEAVEPYLVVERINVTFNYWQIKIKNVMGQISTLKHLNGNTYYV